MASAVNLAEEFTPPGASKENEVDLATEFSVPSEPDQPKSGVSNDMARRAERGLFSAMGYIQKALDPEGKRPDVRGRSNISEYVPEINRFIDPSRDKEIQSILAEAAGASVPAMAASVINPVLGSVVLSAQFGEQTRAESLAEGDTPELAEEKAKIGRLGGAVMGLLPGSAGRGGAGVVERVATRTVTGGAINAAQDATLQYAVKGDVDFDQTLNSFKAGAGMAAIFSLPGPRRAASTKATPEAGGNKTANLAEEFTLPPPITEPVPHIPPEAAAREIARTPPDKLQSLRTVLERPDIDFQYSVWDADMVPPGRDRTMQVDIIPTDPNEVTMGGLGSTNREVLSGLGVDLPPAPDWLPPGSYSRAEIAKAIADGPPATAEVGLGAASPKEFKPVQKFTTSIKNSVVDQERAARGEPPLMEVAKKDLGAAWDEGMAKIDENQNLPDELIAELKESPRPVKDYETAIILQRKIDLQNEFNKANRNITENIGTPDSLAADAATIQRVSDELLDLDTVSRTTGTEQGRGLNARKLIAAEDFSLSSMLTRRRAAKGGAKLTPDEEAQVRKQAADIDEAQQALDRHEAQLELDAAITTPEEAATQVTKLEQEIAAAESAPKPAKKSPEEKRLEATKRNTRKRIEDLKKKIETGDFSKESRPPRNMDEEANTLQAELERTKKQYNDALEKDRFERLTGTQKLLERAGNTYDAAKNIMTTGELSFIGRQGLIQGVSHPIRTAKALPATFKALFADPVTARAIDLQTLNDPAAPRAREAGVHLDEPETRLAKKEEIVMSRWGDKTPIVRNFNQSGRVFLNKLRLDAFKALSDMKPDATKAELASFADYVNQSTGRGGLGQWGERNAVALSRTLFSPRFLTSRFQYLVGNSMWGGTRASNKILAKEYARTLIGLGTIYSLYEFGFAGDEKDGYQPVNFDPRSAMFGKMKIKNTTIDPLAGLSQAIVFGTRTGLTAADAAGFETGPQYMTNKGKLVDLREPKFGQDNWLDVAERFGRSKLHPIPGTVLNLMQGRDVVGQPATIRSEAINFIAPMTYPDIYEALKEQDVDDATAITLLALLGAGINTYQEKEAKTKALRQPTKQLQQLQATP